MNKQVLVSRRCLCGCGEPVVTRNPNAVYLPECRKRVRRARSLEVRSTGKRPLVQGGGRTPKLVCKVCFDLSERRGRTCHGCPLPRVLPEDNESVRTIRAIEAQIQRLKETP